jgi:hypothetical protein
MISTSKIVRVSLGGMLLLLGPLTMQTVDVASAADQNKAAQRHSNNFRC